MNNFIPMQFQTSKINHLLKRLALSQPPHKAILLYNNLLLHDHDYSSSNVDHFTFTYVLKACSLLRPTIIAMNKGREVHARILKCGHISDIFIQNSLLNLYSSVFADVLSVRKIFLDIVSPDVVSWTTLISALAKHGEAEGAISAFASMKVRPNAMTLVGVLPACSRMEDVKNGRAVHAFFLRSTANGGMEYNLILGNALLDMYMRCRDFVRAERLFDEMPQRDVFSWTTMVSGFGRNDLSEQAIEVFLMMLEEGKVAANEATFVSVLCACASLGTLSLGKCLNSYALKYGLGSASFVGNALISMYAKCGDVAVALKVFNELPCKDLVSWCTILGGLALNGFAKQTFQCFSLMICHGLKLDGVAFLAMLSACCHVGMVEQATLIFKSMTEVYDIIPQKEHYTCLVDAYGRAGKVSEAEELVQKMPNGRDRHVWGTLLSATKVCGGTNELSQSLRRRILNEEMFLGAGTYSLMSNILSNVGKDSDDLREHMKIRGIKKVAGCSWVEVA